MENLAGQTLGAYHIKRKIGEGGMASVYLAYQPTLDRDVALKILHPAIIESNARAALRFEREAKAIARLNHANILPIYDFDQQQGYSFIVMQYVTHGRTLNRLLNTKLPVDRAVALAVQIGQALHYAHLHGIVHRDLKPSNILMDGNRPLLADFGLAQVAEANTRLTETNMFIGTPAYVSPEQAVGDPTDERSDIYALGLILYEMLTSDVPHDSRSRRDLLHKRSTQAVKTPRDIVPAIPESIAQVVLRALALHPDARYDTAADFVAALQQATNDATYREPLINDPPTVASGRRWSSPKPGNMVGVIAATLFIVGIGSWGVITQPWQSLAQPVIAVPSVTPTVTLTATPPSTSTPIPPTMTPTASPTVTATPTVTPQPTDTATASPTHTVVRPTATATPTPALPIGEANQLQPNSPDSISRGLTRFEWQWLGSLPPDYGFEVVVWREGQPPMGAHDAVRDNQNGVIQHTGTTYWLETDISDIPSVQGQSGEYRWAIQLVRVSPAYESIRLVSPEATFRFEPHVETGSGGGSPGGGWE